MSVTTISPDRIPTGTYNIDPKHSGVGFEVRHMGIATVRGAFRRFQGTLDATSDAPVLQGAVEVASVDTGEEQRDAHLASPEFFDAEQHPEITFHTTAIEPTNEGSIRLQGEITIKGTTKPIELVGQVAEGGTDPWGNERVGLEITGQFNRSEWDMKFNQALGSGNLLVSDTVKLALDVSAVKQA